jgi:hypothetical protein
MDLQSMPRSISNCSSSIIYTDESDKIKSSDSSMKKSSSFGSSRPSQFKLITYVAPIVEVKKPKNLSGPFDVLDIRNIREAIQKRFKNNYYRKEQEKNSCNQFVEVLNLNEYFEKKKNWMDKSKFVNTYSLYKSINAYLPGYKMKSTKLPVQV